MAGFLGFFNYEKPGKGIAENAPERKGLFLCLELIFRKLGKLIILNAAFVVSCIPLITVGPASAALTQVINDYLDGEQSLDISSYFSAFKKHFKQGLAVGIINLLFALGFLYNLLYFGFTDGLLSSYLTWLFGALTVLLYMVQVFVYNLMAKMRGSVLELYTNAFIITLAKLPMNLLALGGALIYPLIIVLIYFSSVIPQAVSMPIASTLTLFSVFSVTFFAASFYARYVIKNFGRK